MFWTEESEVRTGRFLQQDMRGWYHSYTKSSLFWSTLESLHNSLCFLKLLVNFPYIVGHILTTCMLSHFSHAQLLATPWTSGCQAPLSMGFPSQEYWSGLPFPPPGDLPNPGIKPTSLTSLALAGSFSTRTATWEAQFLTTGMHISALRKICLDNTEQKINTAIEF